jgi:riboflavin kinase/FMN adenylyltransferase
MRVFYGHGSLAGALRGATAALGNFDGVHLGHRHLLAAARAAAPAAPLAVVTFEPHPARVLAPERAPALLTPLARKLELLDAAGVDACVVEPFDRALSGWSAEAFVDRILIDAIGVGHVAIGADFRFGHGRAGTATTLADAGARGGFAVSAVAPLELGGRVASSSRVRAALGAGDVRDAALVLARAHDVEGPVVRGAGRGKGLGVPTANVATADALLPQLGIYAVWAERLDRPGPTLAGAASLGTNPTFGPGAVTLEVHLLDHAGDLYGERLRVGFVERLRGEERFPDVPALIAQMAKDCDAARAIVGPLLGSRGQSAGV